MWPWTQGHSNFLEFKILLHILYPVKVKKCFHFCKKNGFFPKTSKSKKSFHQPLPNERIALSRINDNLWLSQNVCTGCGFCNYLVFLEVFPFFENGNKETAFNVTEIDAHLLKLLCDVTLSFLSAIIKKVKISLFHLQMVLWPWV